MPVPRTTQAAEEITQDVSTDQAEPAKAPKAKPKKAPKPKKATKAATKAKGAKPKADGPKRGVLRVLAAILAAGKAASGETIADALGITRGALSQYLVEAESAGYITSSVGGPEAEEGERAHRYSLTAAGKKLAGKAAEAAGSAKKATSKPLSLMDAAIQVCKNAKAPMRCQEIFDAITSKGLWSTETGKTPVATLSASLLRDSNSEKPRWKKTAPGLFALTALGKK